MGRCFAPLELDEVERVAARLAVDPDTVGKWRRRFAEHRLDGLWDEPRSRTPRTIEDIRIEAVIVRTLETKPPDATRGRSDGPNQPTTFSAQTLLRLQFSGQSLKCHELLVQDTRSPTV
jgi:transposase